MPNVMVSNLLNVVVTPPPPPSGRIVFNPGHYGMYAIAGSQSPIRPSNQASLWSTFSPDIIGAINPATGKCGFRGMQNNYSWFYLDMGAALGQTGNVGPTDGNTGGGTLPPNSAYPAGVTPYTAATCPFNTSLIDKDLATLAAAGNTAIGAPFQLIILVNNEYWQKPSSLPTVPQGNPYGGSNSSGSIAPDYIINGISGQGADLVFTSNSAVPALWRPAVMARYIALHNYLGYKYNGNAQVEAIIGFNEIGFSWNNAFPSDYSDSAFQTQYYAFLAAQVIAAPNKNKFFNDNFGIQPESTATTAARMAHIVATYPGVGFGGPDVIYLNPYGVYTPLCPSGSGNQETYGGANFRGEGFDSATGQTYASENLKGVVAYNLGVQANAYSWLNQTSAGSEAYCFNAGVTHLIWVDTQTNGTSTQTWAGITAALSAVDYRINSTYPSSYPT